MPPPKYNVSAEPAAASISAATARRYRSCLSPSGRRGSIAKWQYVHLASQKGTWT